MSARARFARWGVILWQQLLKCFDSLQNLNAHHAATAATLLGSVIVLGGSFYVGKLLLQRPATDTALVDAEGINTTPRPEVLDVEARANQPVANVDRGNELCGL